MSVETVLPELQLAEDFLSQERFIRQKTRGLSVLCIVGFLDRTDELHLQGKIDDVEKDSIMYMQNEFDKELTDHMSADHKFPQQVTISMNRYRLNLLRKVNENLRNGSLTLGEKFALSDALTDIESSYHLAQKKKKKKPSLTSLLKNVIKG